MSARDEAAALIGEAMRRRAVNGGRHLHSEACIHNLTPEEQIEMRGKTVDYWMRLHGAMPKQITPDEWGDE